MLDDDAGGTLPNLRTSTRLTPGTFTVTETTNAAFTQTGHMQRPEQPNTTTSNGPPPTANINLRAGETVICIFTNSEAGQQTGSITIIKDRIPDGAEDFTFNNMGTGLPASFMLDDDADGTLPSLAWIHRSPACLMGF